MLNWLRNLILGSCYHDWDRWERCNIRVVDDWDCDDSYSTVVSGQSKKCKKCGTMKTRKI